MNYTVFRRLTISARTAVKGVFPVRVPAYERVEELRLMLGLSRRQMMMRIGLQPATYSMWRPGKQQPSLDSLALLAETWHVSLDSLMGRGRRLEPSPDLQEAQEALASRLAIQGDHLGSPTDRLRLCWTLLTGDGGFLPCLTVQVWSDWIRWTPEDWESCLAKQLDAGPHQLRGAARFLGWYDWETAWYHWLSTGRAQSLDPISEHAWKRFYAAVLDAGWDLVDLKRLIAQHKV